MTPIPKLLLSILLTFTLTACGLFSGSKEDDLPADVGATESGEDFFQDGDDFVFDDGAWGDESGDGASEDIFGGTDFFSDEDSFPEAPLSETDTGATDDLFGSDYSTDDSFATDDGFTTDDTFATGDSFGTGDTYIDPFTDTATSGAYDSFETYDDLEFGTEETAQRSFVPVKKMADSAFYQGGANLNRLYVMREGDTLESVSQKIFGRDRTDEIRAWNPYFASNSPKVGDKLYYPSPNNPDDSTMMTYYDDVGAPAQTYISSEGDNIRSVSQNLLGHERSWMEIWATNANVESKGELPSGVSLRYWPEGVAAPAQAAAPSFEEDPFGAPPPVEDLNVADSTAPEQDPFGSLDSTDSLGGMSPPPSFGDDDPFGDSAASTPPPPPPRMEELTLPPPPPPPPRAAAKPAPATGGDDNLVLLIAGGGAALLIIIYLLVRRRKNSVDMGHTQV